MMLLFRLYLWSHPPMMLLYFRVQFIPGEILDAFYFPLLFVRDLCPLWDAHYTEITFFWWFIDWIVESALQCASRARMRAGRAVHSNVECLS